MRPPIRWAALMEQGVIFVFTHDSIALGEDSSTHQPVEQLAPLRAIIELATSVSVEGVVDARATQRRSREPL